MGAVPANNDDDSNRQEELRRAGLTDMNRGTETVPATSPTLDQLKEILRADSRFPPPAHPAAEALMKSEEDIKESFKGAPLCVLE